MIASINSKPLKKITPNDSTPYNIYIHISSSFGFFPTFPVSTTFNFPPPQKKKHRRNTTKHIFYTNKKPPIVQICLTELFE